MSAIPVQPELISYSQAPAIFSLHTPFCPTLKEIVFHYSFGMLRVKGDHLNYIYSLVRRHELGSINCDTGTSDKPDDPHIREIVFEEIDAVE
jgi:hypothetical protein